MANTFDWVEIKAKNIEETANFYESLFDWKIIEKKTADGLDFWIFDTGSKPRIENLQRGGIWVRPEGEALGVLVYVFIDDIASVLKKLTELGGNVVIPKTPQGPSGFRACFADPSGNLFGLWEEKNKG